MTRTKLGRRELLYDKQRLAQLRDEHENANKIKEAVKTPAFVYEIRTALNYWFDGKNTWRCNDNIWDRCKAVDEGNLTLVGDTLKYEEDVDNTGTIT